MDRTLLWSSLNTRSTNVRQRLKPLLSDHTLQDKPAEHSQQKKTLFYYTDWLLLMQRPCRKSSDSMPYLIGK